MRGKWAAVGDVRLFNTPVAGLARVVCIQVLANVAGFAEIGAVFDGSRDERRDIAEL